MLLAIKFSKLREPRELINKDNLQIDKERFKITLK